MEEIKVGEWVRTKEGYIAKVIEIDNSYVFSEDTLSKQTDIGIPCDYEAICNIVKHGYNIKNLIEEGDIVEYKVLLNGVKLGRVRKYTDARSHKEYLGIDGFKIEKLEISSIMTKEQFNNGKYNVGNTEKS